MNWVHAVLLGVVEGLTEFLPISSTGHLILATRLLGLPETEFMKTFQIAIQVGAILAVLFCYRGAFLLDAALWKRVLAAFLPTAVIGYLLYALIKDFFFSHSSVVLWSLFLGGIVLILFDRFYKERPGAAADIRKMSLLQAGGIGLVQALSVVPGVSRAAATILGGLCLGLDRRTAVEFSFLLAVPTLVAATALDLLKTPAVLHAGEFGLLFIGAAVSFVVAVFSIRFFLGFVSKHGFTAFGVYRIVLAGIFWIFVR